MVTKTLILRPIMSYTSDDSISEIYLNVNEEVADDNSTKTTVSATIPLTNWFKFDCDYLNLDVKNIKVYTRCNYTDINFRLRLDIFNKDVFLNNENILESLTYTAPTSKETWETQIVSVLNITDFMDTLNEGTLFFRYEGIFNNASGKLNQISITQIYIEIEYEEEELFIKKEDNWIEISHKIYKKENNEWRELKGLSLENQLFFVKDYLTLPDVLKDFNAKYNSDGNYELTTWKGTLNGEESTEIIIPDGLNIDL